MANEQATEISRRAPRRPIAYDTRLSGIDYRLCRRCATLVERGGAEMEPVFAIGPGETSFCEECDDALGA